MKKVITYDADTINKIEELVKQKECKELVIFLYRNGLSLEIPRGRHVTESHKINVIGNNSKIYFGIAEIKENFTLGENWHEPLDEVKELILTEYILKNSVRFPNIEFKPNIIFAFPLNYKPSELTITFSDNYSS